MSQKITPCLWFDGDAEEAAKFYVSLLPNSRIDTVFRSPTDTPSGKAGTVLTVEFTLAGTQYLGLNGGPNYTFNQAVSFMINCDTQEEVDRLWNTIKREGKEIACGWISDKWGLPWQIVPKRLSELIKDPDPARARRAMEAMMKMVKIDIAALERAVAG
ncbi:MAG TPA: VOC family protein [Steroidobacteraceae bacterium]|jgi:predicted 3-demethylubiquinone-9 3-methyltransferase (glyoxalase superfamily)|nr:VOC family protein [Steroidobacteraceae bacterium]